MEDFGDAERGCRLKIPDKQPVNPIGILSLNNADPVNKISKITQFNQLIFKK